MDLSVALIIYFVVLLVVYLVARSASVRLWSSIILALVVGLAVLLLLQPLGTITTAINPSFTTTIYLGILIATPILALIYIFCKALSDRV